MQFLLQTIFVLGLRQEVQPKLQPEDPHEDTLDKASAAAAYAVQYL
jgi:hypothetical protein